MNTESRMKYKAQLLDIRRSVTSDGTSPIKVENSGLAHEIQDEDTQPLSEMSQVIASNRNRNRTASLDRIDSAIAHIENHPDEFGICQDCGEDIPVKRLDLMPFAELCARCQQAKDETAKGLPGRRHLTDYK